MQIGFPENYPSACALPFNRQCLGKAFQLMAPNQEPADSGVWLLLKGQSVLTLDGNNGPELPSGTIPLEIAEREPIFIGNWQGRPCRMLFINENFEFPKNLKEHSLHSQNPQIPLSILSLAGVGLMINHWEESSQFCGYCGNKLTRLKQDWGKRCHNCDNQHFPRIHPCVIGLIIRGEEILLVRNPGWVAGRYGLVAGFVEFGESLEEAMARETAEETGLRINNIRYLGSQSWPFPSQIMNGFVADYAGGDLKLQKTELEAADWYRLDKLPAIPPRRSIARYLIDRAAEFLQP